MKRYKPTLNKFLSITHEKKKEKLRITISSPPLASKHQKGKRPKKDRWLQPLLVVLRLLIIGRRTITIIIIIIIIVIAIIVPSRRTRGTNAKSS